MLKKLYDNLCNTWIGRMINKMFSFAELAMMKNYKGEESIKLIKQIIKEDKKFYFRSSEMFMIYSLSLRQKKIKGDYAEVGVYNGSSAKVMCETKGDKHLYLFDTFEWLPEVDKIDTGYSKKMFAGNYEYVKQRLSQYGNVHIHKGLFPETSGPIENNKFAFVHLDVDIYQSTKDGLEFFYERMQNGGIILSHDYSQSRGVKKAFNEFFTDKPEEIIELPMTQCMIIKND